VQAVTPCTAHNVPAAPPPLAQGPDPGSAWSAQPLPCQECPWGISQHQSRATSSLARWDRHLGGIINFPASRQHLYVCLEVSSTASQTWEQGMERGMSQLGLTAPPSPRLQPTQDRTFRCPPPPCTPSTYSTFQPRCPHGCAMQRLGCLRSRCLPSQGAACHALACLAVPCSLALGTGAHGGAMGVSARREGSQGQTRVAAASRETLLII